MCLDYMKIYTPWNCVLKICIYFKAQMCFSDCLDICSHATLPATYPAQNQSILRAVMFMGSVGWSFQGSAEKAPAAQSNFSQLQSVWFAANEWNKCPNAPQRQRVSWPHHTLWGWTHRRRVKSSRFSQQFTSTHICSVPQPNSGLIVPKIVNKYLLIKCSLRAEGTKQTSSEDSWAVRAEAMEACTACSYRMAVVGSAALSRNTSLEDTLIYFTLD